MKVGLRDVKYPFCTSNTVTIKTIDDKIMVVPLARAVGKVFF